MFLLAFICDEELPQTPGVHMYNMPETDVDRTYCWNTSLSPTYLAFDQYGKNSMFSQYTWSTVEDEKVLYDKTEIRYLDPVIRFDKSASVQLTQPAGSPLTFTLANLPGMCNDGIIFSNYVLRYLDFSTTNDDFFNLKPNSDKCILFTGYSQQEIQILLQSSCPKDQVLIYENEHYYESLTAGTNGTYKCDSSQLCLIRVLITNSSFDAKMSIAQSSFNGSSTYYYDAYYLPDLKVPACKHQYKWHNEKIMITLIATTGFFIATTIILCVTVCVKSSDVHSRHDRNYSTNDSFQHMSSVIDFSFFN